MQQYHHLLKHTISQHIHTLIGWFPCCRKDAEVNMDGQFLVRQIYEDEITYNLVGAAVKILSQYFFIIYAVSPNYDTHTILMMDCQLHFYYEK